MRVQQRSPRSVVWHVIRRYDGTAREPLRRFCFRRLRERASRTIAPRPEGERAGPRPRTIGMGDERHSVAAARPGRLLRKRSRSSGASVTGIGFVATARCWTRRSRSRANGTLALRPRSPRRQWCSGADTVPTRTSPAPPLSDVERQERAAASHREGAGVRHGGPACRPASRTCSLTPAAASRG